MNKRQKMEVRRVARKRATILTVAYMAIVICMLLLMRIERGISFTEMSFVIGLFCVIAIPIYRESFTFFEKLITERESEKFCKQELRPLCRVVPTQDNEFINDLKERAMFFAHKEDGFIEIIIVYKGDEKRIHYEDISPEAFCFNYEVVD